MLLHGEVLSHVTQSELGRLRFSMNSERLSKTGTFACNVRRRKLEMGQPHGFAAIGSFLVLMFVSRVGKGCGA